MSQFSFTDLTPDTILDAIESLGIYVESGLLPLNSYENRVYQFVAEDQKRYVAKFYRPQRWSLAQIQEEHDFAFELEAAEVPVVAPLKFSGKSIHEYGGYLFTLYSSVGGRMFEQDSLEQLEWMGRFIGRIHQTGRREAFTHRPTMNVTEYLDDAASTIKSSGFIPMTLETAFVTILDQTVDAAKANYTPGETIRLHGDCHAGNILWTPDGPSFVDLDDSRNGPAIQDIWMMLSGDRQNQLLQLDTLVEGYESFAHFDESQLTLVEPLRAMRIVHYMAWLAKRWDDPAFPRNFGWFTSDKYWEQQILTLKEQLAALHEPPLSLSPGL